MANIQKHALVTGAGGFIGLNTDRSLVSFGFLRVSAVSPELRVADVAFNTQVITDAMQQVASQGGQLAVFPELCITGYSCADLFYQALLRDKARQALDKIAVAAQHYGIIALVGLPLEIGGRLFNCATLIGPSGVLGIIPKTYLPTTNEYYEERWFTSAIHARVDQVEVNGVSVPFGTNLLFKVKNVPHCVIGVEVCEDLWAVNPPSGPMALAGATVLLNPSASVDLLGKADYRRDLIRQQSARCLAAYLYAGAGPSKSTTDLVFGGHSLIAENGNILDETERFQFSTQIVTTDIDLQRLVTERLKNSSFSMAAQTSYKVIETDVAQSRIDA